MNVIRKIYVIGVLLSMLGAMNAQNENDSIPNDSTVILRDNRSGTVNITDILPQLSRLQPIEPTTASLGKYGEYDMNYSNGQPNISFSLYEIKSGDLTIPIELRYQSGGIRVDQEASWVGLGWDLFYGGQVSRTVNGQPDENEVSSKQRPTWNDVREYMNKHSSETYDSHLEQISNESYMPDEYNYNTGTESGKFIGREIEIIVPYKQNKISYNVNSGVEITNTKGERYCFSPIETTTTLNQIQNTIAPYTSAWGIEYIISPNNHIIKYKYQTDGDFFKSGTLYWQGYTIRNGSGCIPNGILNAVDIINGNDNTTRKVSGKKPQYIYFDGGRLYFSLTSRADLTSSNLQNSLQRLDYISVQYLSPDNTTYITTKNIVFNYSYKDNRLMLENVTENSIVDNKSRLIASFYYDQTPFTTKKQFFI